MFTARFIQRGWVVWLFLLAILPRDAVAQSKEYQIKAAFLYNFAQFVEWPESVFASTNAQFVIGILGDDPFGTALDETIHGEKVGTHQIAIQRSQRIDDLKSCQMIFVSKSEKHHVGHILAALGTKPVLTVSEIDGFASDGGGINFYLEGNKVRFEINPDAAKADGLAISSQLLSLGRIVSSMKEEK